MMKTFCYILTFIFLPFEILYPQWKLIGLSGEDIQKINHHPTNNNTIYAGSSFVGTTSIGGFFISTNSGITWDTLITGISVTDFVIDYQNPNIIYLALGLSSPTGTGIIKSTDGGYSWFNSNNGIFISWEVGLYPIAIDPMDPRILYCGTLGPMGGNLYKTTNGGLNWFTPSADTSLFYSGVAVIELDPYNTAMLYIGRAMNGKLFRSIDGGVNFEFAGYENGGGIKNLKFGRNSDEIYVTSFWSFAFPVGVFRTTNGGTTWKNIGEGFSGRVDVGDVALNFANKNFIYIGAAASEDTSGVYVKVDSSNWTLIGLNNEFINSLIIKNDQLWAGIYGGIYVRDLISHIGPEKDYYFQISLLSAYPNPFNPTTKIRYSVASDCSLILKIYDVLGREVTVLVNEEKKPGTYEVKFNASNLSSGIYFYKISAGNFQQTRKMILLK